MNESKHSLQVTNEEEEALRFLAQERLKKDSEGCIQLLWIVVTYVVVFHLFIMVGVASVVVWVAILHGWRP